VRDMNKADLPSVTAFNLHMHLNRRGKWVTTLEYRVATTRDDKPFIRYKYESKEYDHYEDAVRWGMKKFNTVSRKVRRGGSHQDAERGRDTLLQQ